MSFGGFYYPAFTPGFGSKPRLQTTHPFRNLLASGSHLNNHWSAASGQSDYALDAPEYDYQSGPAVHVPSGGSYSYHATAGAGYGAPAHHAPHPPTKPVAQSTGGGKKGLFGGGGGGKHGCIKDHMDAMNPTVMVMTTNIIRNRFNKMGELNSREQSSAYSSNAASIVVHPHDLIQAAAAPSASIADATTSSLNLQSSYSNKPISFNKPLVTAITQSSESYVPNNPEPEIAINYEYVQHHYDPHKPDPKDQVTQQQHTLSYANQTLSPAQTPPHKFTPVEQHYNFHHPEYNAQPAPAPAQSSANIPFYSTSSKPFYEHQDPLTASKPFNNVYGSYYGGLQPDYDLRQKFETNHQQHYPHSSANKAHPWSTNLQTASVVSGPYRRASVIAVAPKTKWIAVPAKIIDRSNFHTSAGDVEEHFTHHDDRDVFRSRLN